MHRSIRAYIMAPIFTAEQLEVVNVISHLLSMNGYVIFNPYTASREIWKGRKPADCTEDERRQVLRQNIDRLHWADVGIARLDGTAHGKVDTGVTWEMGYMKALSHESAYAKHPRFMLAYIADVEHAQPINLMLAGTVDALVVGTSQLTDALSLLSDSSRWRECQRLFPPVAIRQEDQAMPHERGAR